MAALLKPQRPSLDNPNTVAGGTAAIGGGVVNPRSQRTIAGMEQLLQQVAASQPTAGTKISPRAALQDLSNQLSPRLNAKKPIRDSSPTKYVLPKAPVLPPPAAAAPSAVAAAGGANPLSSRSRSSPAAPAATTTRCMSPNTALLRHGSSLTSYEKQEILNYEEIYFTGDTNKKVQASSSSSSSSNNFGYDDDKGDYKVVYDDHIKYRFQILSELGRGSFGQVSKALDHKTKQVVALKIIKNKKKFHDQALIEVELLKHLRDHDVHEKHHIIKLVDHFIFRNHMCITFELHGMNLYELCKANRFAPMNIPVIKHFAKQLLNTLQYLYSQRVVHCDMKPENILLKNGSKSTIKVIDFGSSCFENQRLYTYIQSRFYRAPEVMLGIPYTPAIDVWSFGCILAELANGYPIFPGESEQEQMTCLMEYLGVPPRSLIDRGSRKKNFFDANGTPKLPANSRGKIRRPSTKDLGSFLRVSSANLNDPEGGLFVDFVANCLTWDPNARWTPMQAMQHPWISGNEPTQVQSARPVATGANGSSASSSAAAGGGGDAAKSPRVILPLLPQTSRRY